MFNVYYSVLHLKFRKLLNIVIIHKINYNKNRDGWGNCNRILALHKNKIFLFKLSFKSEVIMWKEGLL